MSSIGYAPMLFSTGAVVLTTMNPLFVNSGTTWTFSGGNLIVSANSSAFGQDRSLVSHSAGKYYFEMTFTLAPTTNGVVGIISSSDTNGNWPGKTTTSYGLRVNGVVATQGNNNSSPWPVAGTWSTTFAQGDIIGWAVDLTGLTVNIYKNGTLITPSANTIASGTYYAAVGVPNGGAAYTFTSNFGQTPFSTAGGLPPAGYSNW